MIPIELTAYAAWVARGSDAHILANPTDKSLKIPLNVRTGEHASSTDPATWASFAQVVELCRARPQYGPGFVLSESDPYTVIDLDNKERNPELHALHESIVQQFGSYTEVSPSGKGMHVWVRGTSETIKDSRYGIEVYSSKRYITVTGNTLLDAPIADRQELLNKLAQELRPKQQTTVAVTDGPQVLEDHEVYERCVGASSGQLFIELWNGTWQNRYQSASEADQAFTNLVANQTDSKDQIKRLFAASALGAREKAHRADYVERNVTKSLDRKTTLAFPGLAAITQQVETSIATIADTSSELDSVEPTKEWTCPTGLVGEIASYIYAAANRPVREVALVGALALCSGLWGRGYNVNGSGLNGYYMLIAGTGVGKEAAQTGMDKIVNKMMELYPSATKHRGPARISSAQALEKHLAQESQCFYTVIGEAGLWLQKILHPDARQNEQDIMATLLALYSRSGASQTMHGTIYSDKKKNTEAVRAPNFTLLGESTPEEFYKAIDINNIASGFVSRLTVVEYLGKRPADNEHTAEAALSPQMVQRLMASLRGAHQTEQAGRAIEVGITPGAREMLRDFNAYCDDKINDPNAIEFAKQLWNRAHIRTMKLAAVLAVGESTFNPTINEGNVRWAHDLVEYGLNKLFARFVSGRVGRSQDTSQQFDDTVQCLRTFFLMSTQDVRKTARNNGITDALIGARIVTDRHLVQQLRNLSSFRSERDPIRAVHNMVQTMIDNGFLQPMNNREVSVNGKVYRVLPEVLQHPGTP